jgi:protein tyrosine/serine phosphatase
MPKLKPWFHVVTPREDLRENRPVDASGEDKVSGTDPSHVTVLEA